MHAVVRAHALREAPVHTVLPATRRQSQALGRQSIQVTVRALRRLVQHHHRVHPPYPLSEVCVLLFPRSTSMLEGHNGQDALCQHQRHAISDAFRAARLVVRNYVIERADGTTAAERLFGRKRGDLIEYLCEHVELPGRGRITKRRSRKPALALTG